MSEIAVGELVVMQKAGYYEEWNGALGVIVGSLHARPAMDLNTMTRNWGLCYRVRILAEGGCVVSAGPHQVRRLRGPEVGVRKRATEDADATQA
jgi:hypothetical protein